MDHPDKGVEVSSAPAGEVELVPEQVTGVAVTDGDGEPVGALEKWSPDAWIYASVDSLREIN